MSSTTGPRCPNHRVLLTDCKAGIGICPISGANFTYEADETKRTRKLKLDSLGRAYMSDDWQVESTDREEA